MGMAQGHELESKEKKKNRLQGSTHVRPIIVDDAGNHAKIKKFAVGASLWAGEYTSVLYPHNFEMIVSRISMR